MQNRSWKKVLQEASSDPHDLLNKLNIEDFSSISKQANKDFPQRVPPGFANRINQNDPDDPLLRQVLPSVEEENDHAGFTEDPLNEVNRQISPGLLHKYQ